MGAALSKLWDSLRSALSGTGGANTSTTARKDNQQPHNHSTSAVKDTESGSETPVQSNGTAMPEVKKYEITEPWLKLNCSLGEGPFWEEDTNTLRFLDVEKQRVHLVDLNVGPSSHRVLKEFDISMGCTADIEGNPNEFAFAGKYGFGIANKQTGEYRWVQKVWSPEEHAAGKPHKFRGNDGAVDSQGRFWAGFMFDPLVSEWSTEGAVFRLNTDGSLDRVLSDITIPNGTTWNKSDDTMYFTDSPFGTIYQFDYDPATGNIKNKRPFFSMPEDKRYGENAVPDGHCLDEEGYMWTALHGGSRVIRISPQGEIVAEIKLPTEQITCPCFCGDDLIITSMGGTAGPDGKPLDEFAGSLFKINVGVRGLKRFKYKGGESVEGGKVNGQVVGE